MVNWSIGEERDDEDGGNAECVREERLKKSMVAGLEGLRIFQLAEELADAVWAEVMKWKPFAQATVGRQVVEAADSVGANSSEGHGRYHYREEITFDYYGRGSLKEARYWLRRARARDLMADATYKCLIAKVDQLEPQLNAYINSLERKATAAPPRRRATT